MTDTAPRPTVKLRPGKGRRLAEGAPWAFADEIAMDRRTKGLAPGTLVRLVEGETALGLAAFNPESKIAARLIDCDTEVEVGRDWFAARLGHALALRARLFDAPFYRLVHAEGDGLPGLVIDRFGEAAVIQPNAAWLEPLLPDLEAALMAVTGCTMVVVNATARVRRLEGLDERLEVTHGSLDGPIPVTMNGATYLADLTGGQKTGLFYDQRPNHAFAAGLARGGRVLDVFTHVGGFALAALAAGAESALGIDSSAPALELAEGGARLTGVAERFATRRADAFAAMEALAGEGSRFDLVVCDPPAFAPSKDALPQGLRAYERLARLGAGLVAPGGWLVLCSCSHAADPESFHRANAKGIGRAGRTAQLVNSGRAGPDHPSHVALPETSYLKAMVYRLD
ncbi:class I SAM-dependent rRNA methyltransferase [Limibaculum sp. FT325]|uniref:RSP_2647 family RNA methyltransferase n=1 Tax=Thermohalobaculum sediminis TaxID=2939436 RepID=UPI0020BEF4C8|nr:class I SAM-dependent rRNA methyltransferase [Limibaculum sediminis]MCL5777340.1 class I SAM-dependent rRNA methyltransferase [Limibaculum sediminis]